MKWLVSLVVAALALPVAGQQVALTFDDLPTHGPLPAGETRLEIAEQILTTLRDQHLPPVYGFVNAEGVAGTPKDYAVLKAWRTAGLPLGNHTWSHVSINASTVPQFEAEIAKDEPMLRSLMQGEDWHWFRYPFLVEGETLEKRRAVRSYLERHGYQIAEVSIDFEDYLWNEPYARCVAKRDGASIETLRTTYLATADQYITFYRDLSHTLYGRDISYVVLLHIGAFDAKMLPELIALFRRRGFGFVTLPEAMNDPVYAVDPDIAWKDGGAFQELVAEVRHEEIPPNTKPYKQLAAMCR